MLRLQGDTGDVTMLNAYVMERCCVRWGGVGGILQYKQEEKKWKSYALCMRIFPFFSANLYRKT